MTRAVLMVWGAALLLCGGCTQQTAPPKTAAVGTAHWKIALICTPARPRQLDPATLEARVTDSAGQPISGARVTLSLAMPAMAMGQNEVPAPAVTDAPGKYAGTGRFTMPGDWSVTVSADKEAAHQSQAFPVTVR